MDNCLFRTAQSFKRAANQVLAALNEHLHGNIVRNQIFLDERTRKRKFRVRCRREPDFDFLETDIAKHLEHFDFFFDVHRHGERLIPVPQIDATPHGRFFDAGVRPTAIRDIHLRERGIFCDFVMLHKKE